MHRRKFLHNSVLILTALALWPKLVLAKIWNKPAFETTKLSEALNALGVEQAKISQDILINAPERAENGAVVQIEITSNLANTESITILVERNPTPLIAEFKLSSDLEAYVVTRIKMAETSDLTVVVKAGGHFFTQTKNIVVLENGCG
jgi:sulfur-oxidizing protein SoxY